MSRPIEDDPGIDHGSSLKVTPSTKITTQAVNQRPRPKKPRGMVGFNEIVI